MFPFLYCSLLHSAIVLCPLAASMIVSDEGTEIDKRYVPKSPVHFFLLLQSQVMPCSPFLYPSLAVHSLLRWSYASHPSRSLQELLLSSTSLSLFIFPLFLLILRFNRGHQLSYSLSPSPSSTNPFFDCIVLLLVPLFKASFSSELQLRRKFRGSRRRKRE